MHDIFGAQYAYLEKIRQTAVEMAKNYGFEGIETPLLEDVQLFTRGVGKLTDIVGKEMYTFKTKGDDQVALRPEGTASVMRSFIEHNLYTRPQPVKFFYFGPFFRYERPQAGRYRQFWQFGVEVIGKGGPSIDAQVIILMCNILKELGLEKVIVELNSMGDEGCRSSFESALRRYLKSISSSLCMDCKSRMTKNPLRALDCKKCIHVKEGAPQLMDHICKECRNDFKNLLEMIEEAEVAYSLNPFLARGLDYYNGAVYEFFLAEGEEALALGGGGRYDRLGALLGDEERPAAGAALGLDRIAALMDKKGALIKREQPRVFIAQLGDLAKKKGLRLFEEFRAKKIPVAESFAHDSLKSQLNRADRMGVSFVLILGKEEAAENRVILRDMETGNQEKIEIKEAVKEIKQKLKKRQS